MVGADLRRSVAALAVALPPLVLGAATIGVLVLAAGGVHPLWPATVSNPSEAVATGDEAAFIRLVLAGASPSARAVVRAGLRESVDVPMTPLEVAVDTQSERAVNTVLKHGAVVNAETARGAMCIALRKAPNLMPLLKAHGAPDVDVESCPKSLGEQIEMLRSLR